MELSGIHLLLTYRCLYECDHCFVWGGPRQGTTMTLGRVRTILEAAAGLGTVEWIYFEGGEPFLYYPVVVDGVRRAAEMGFEVGIVSNAYWATDEEDAVAWLKPFEGRVGDLSISRDPYHGSETAERRTRHAVVAAKRLGIPVGTLSIAEPEAMGPDGEPPEGRYPIRFRGRAAEKLVDRVGRRSWTSFDACPGEELRDPGRVHVDPEGYVHVCQGISVGNLFETPLEKICEKFDPDAHPVLGPLLAGGPAELVRRYGVAHADGYADACHLCYEARRALRDRFPSHLAPAAMYGGEEE